MLDESTLNDFIRLLIDLTGASPEQLLDDGFQQGCLALVLAKNKRLEMYGSRPWPENIVKLLVRNCFRELRSAHSS